MSTPPVQPPDEPVQPSPDSTTRLQKAAQRLAPRSSAVQRKGGIVATAAVLVSSAIGVGVSGSGLFGFLYGNLVAFLGVILGSILVIFKQTRAFAQGCLITSAILIFVTAGLCTVTATVGHFLW